MQQPVHPVEIEEEHAVTSETEYELVPKDVMDLRVLIVPDQDTDYGLTESKFGHGFFHESVVSEGDSEAD